MKEDTPPKNSCQKCYWLGKFNGRHVFLCEGGISTNNWVTTIDGFGVSKEMKDWVKLNFPQFYNSDWTLSNTYFAIMKLLR